MAEAENVDPRVPAVWRARFSGEECGEEFADKVLAIDHFRERVERDLAAADAADPLRVLLADEDRALEVMAAASHEARRDHSPWSSRPEWYREKWRALQRSEHGAVLAALREVAGDG